MKRIRSWAVNKVLATMLYARGRTATFAAAMKSTNAATTQQNSILVALRHRQHTTARTNNSRAAIQQLPNHPARTQLTRHLSQKVTDTKKQNKANFHSYIPLNCLQCLFPPAVVSALRAAASSDACLTSLVWMSDDEVSAAGVTLSADAASHGVRVEATSATGKQTVRTYHNAAVIPDFYRVEDMLATPHTTPSGSTFSVPLHVLLLERYVKEHKLQCRVWTTKFIARRLFGATIRNGCSGTLVSPFTFPIYNAEETSKPAEIIAYFSHSYIPQNCRWHLFPPAVAAALRAAVSCDARLTSRMWMSDDEVAAGGATLSADAASHCVRVETTWASCGKSVRTYHNAAVIPDFCRIQEMLAACHTMPDGSTFSEPLQVLLLERYVKEHKLLYRVWTTKLIAQTLFAAAIKSGFTGVVIPGFPSPIYNAEETSKPAEIIEYFSHSYIPVNCRGQLFPPAVASALRFAASSDACLTSRVWMSDAEVAAAGVTLSADAATLSVRVESTSATGEKTVRTYHNAAVIRDFYRIKQMLAACHTTPNGSTFSGPVHALLAERYVNEHKLRCRVWTTKFIAQTVFGATIKSGCFGVVMAGYPSPIYNAEETSKPAEIIEYFSHSYIPLNCRGLLFAPAVASALRIAASSDACLTSRMWMSDDEVAASGVTLSADAASLGVRVDSTSDTGEKTVRTYHNAAVIPDLYRVQQMLAACHTTPYGSTFNDPLHILGLERYVKEHKLRCRVWTTKFIADVLFGATIKSGCPGVVMAGYPSPIYNAEETSKPAEIIEYFSHSYIPLNCRGRLFPPAVASALRAAASSDARLTSRMWMSDDEVAAGGATLSADAASHGARVEAASATGVESTTTGEKTVRTYHNAAVIPDFYRMQSILTACHTTPNGSTFSDPLHILGLERYVNEHKLRCRVWTTKLIAQTLFDATIKSDCVGFVMAGYPSPIYNAEETSKPAEIIEYFSHSYIPLNCRGHLFPPAVAAALRAAASSDACLKSRVWMSDDEVAAAGVALSADAASHGVRVESTPATGKQTVRAYHNAAAIPDLYRVQQMLAACHTTPYGSTFCDPLHILGLERYVKEHKLRCRVWTTKFIADVLFGATIKSGCPGVVMAGYPSPIYNAEETSKPAEIIEYFSHSYIPLNCRGRLFPPAVASALRAAASSDARLTSRMWMSDDEVAAGGATLSADAASHGARVEAASPTGVESTTTGEKEKTVRTYHNAAVIPDFYRIQEMLAGCHTMPSGSTFSVPLHALVLERYVKEHKLRCRVWTTKLIAQTLFVATIKTSCSGVLLPGNLFPIYNAEETSKPAEIIEYFSHSYIPVDCRGHLFPPAVASALRAAASSDACVTSRVWMRDDEVAAAGVTLSADAASHRVRVEATSAAGEKTVRFYHNAAVIPDFFLVEEMLATPHIMPTGVTFSAPLLPTNTSDLSYLFVLERYLKDHNLQCRVWTTKKISETLFGATIKSDCSGVLLPGYPSPIYNAEETSKPAEIIEYFSHSYVPLDCRFKLLPPAVASALRAAASSDACLTSRVWMRDDEVAAAGVTLSADAASHGVRVEATSAAGEKSVCTYHNVAAVSDFSRFPEMLAARHTTPNESTFSDPLHIFMLERYVKEHKLRCRVWTTKLIAQTLFVATIKTSCSGVLLPSNLFPIYNAEETSKPAEIIEYFSHSYIPLDCRGHLFPPAVAAALRAAASLCSRLTRVWMSEGEVVASGVSLSLCGAGCVVKTEFESSSMDIDFFERRFYNFGSVLAALRCAIDANGACVYRLLYPAAAATSPPWNVEGVSSTIVWGPFGDALPPSVGVFLHGIASKHGARSLRWTTEAVVSKIFGGVVFNKILAVELHCAEGAAPQGGVAGLPSPKVVPPAGVPFANAVPPLLLYNSEHTSVSSAISEYFSYSYVPRTLQGGLFVPATAAKLRGVAASRGYTRTAWMTLEEATCALGADLSSLPAISAAAVPVGGGSDVRLVNVGLVAGSTNLRCPSQFNLFDAHESLRLAPAV